MFENVWWTVPTTMVSLDKGSCQTTFKNFGDFSSLLPLFFNYIHNTSLLSSSVDKAKSLTRPPRPFMLNMVQPKVQAPWTLLKNYPYLYRPGSTQLICSWEKPWVSLALTLPVKQGSLPACVQSNYGWRFTEPCHHSKVADRQTYNAYNYSWHGMASFMTTQCHVGISEEPLVRLTSIS